MTTYEVYVTSQTNLSVIPEGTEIKILDTSEPNQIELRVSHRDELTVKRLVFQIWGLTKNEDCYPVDLV